MLPTPAAAPQSRLLRIRLGTSDTAGATVGLPVLDGGATEDLFPLAVPAGEVGAYALYRQEAWLVGRGSLPVGRDLEATTRRLYGELLALARGRALVRIWNYVPAINDPGDGGLENYRAFCRGRAEAFEGEFGENFKRHASAASAVGSDGDRLEVMFAACAAPVRHVENPRQVPAYDYPPEHGPRAPVFARASIVDIGEQTRSVFVSGTAAISGHSTVAAGDTPAQLECTLQNLREISRACGLGSDLAAGRAPGRHFKVYLRHATELAAVQVWLESALVRAEDQVVYLRSDICRRELNVEIEAALPLVPIG